MVTVIAAAVFASTVRTSFESFAPTPSKDEIVTSTDCTGIGDGAVERVGDELGARVGEPAGVAARVGMIDWTGPVVVGAGVGAVRSLLLAAVGEVVCLPRGVLVADGDDVANDVVARTSPGVRNALVVVAP